jgi:hypothetical protein
VRVLMIGAPGAGKGTQGVRVAAHYDIAHISSSDLLREHIASDRASAAWRAAAWSAGIWSLMPSCSICCASQSWPPASGGYVLAVARKSAVDPTHAARGRTPLPRSARVAEFEITDCCGMRSAVGPVSAGGQVHGGRRRVAHLQAPSTDVTVQHSFLEPGRRHAETVQLAGPAARPSRQRPRRRRRSPCRGRACSRRRSRSAQIVRAGRAASRHPGAACRAPAPPARHGVVGRWRADVRAGAGHGPAPAAQREADVARVGDAGRARGRPAGRSRLPPAPTGSGYCSP